MDWNVWQTQVGHRQYDIEMICMFQTVSASLFLSFAVNNYVDSELWPYRQMNQSTSSCLAYRIIHEYYCVWIKGNPWFESSRGLNPLVVWTDHIIRGTPRSERKRVSNAEDAARQTPNCLLESLFQGPRWGSDRWLCQGTWDRLSVRQLDILSSFPVPSKWDERTVWL